jgi:peptidoglycan lytic transglycosylase
MNRVIGSRRRHAYAVCALLCASLALPAGASASSGGSGLVPGGAPLEPPAAAQSGNVTVSASGDGITISTRESAMLRKGMSFVGTAPSSLAGDTVEIERSGHETNWTWAPTVTATIAPDGTFAAIWTNDHIGRFAIRAIIVSSQSASVAEDATTTPSLTVTVYRPSLATQYGPGFYGQRTACGQRLRVSTIGVANRTLRCGESVAIYYRGRTLVVPVIDRGPFANGADWDLTEATGRALGIEGTAEIGAVSLPNPPSAALRRRSDRARR